ncbi:pyridoxal phosphate-dependent transferase [Lineolata rhizophorae]|uniref:Pyridoxal phosphate-dependent transferase n=1 Tax=Lineolata rhizophorae TaxID=578093 RepID=A0A6A6NWZ1_9PEZI|nr:pyridoxal phosphate-dependent transferase [Lineolata rhizophorae]
MTTMASTFNIAGARSNFPALGKKQVYFDNAGGSQVLGPVIQSISDYLSNNNVQMGATYAVGCQSSDRYKLGYLSGAAYINAEPDEVVIGPSTTQLFRNLSSAITFSPGDELVLSKFEHEANIASWVDTAAQLGLTVKWWTAPQSTNPQLDPAELKKLLSPKTKLVACTHVSNILGTLNDIKTIAAMVHEVPGALLCVDGVSYAPHRRVDVKDLGVDFYCLSWYKVYGPHMAMLYASRTAQESLRSLGHFFNPTATLENKLGLAASNYELTQTIPIIRDYLGGSDPDPVFAAIAAHEAKLQTILLEYLNSRRDITVFGETDPDPAIRVPTISFVVKEKSSRGIVESIDNCSDYGLRWGHFYSKRLCDEILGLGEEGVVRVSMVHYNTEEEINGLIKVLDRVISA